MRSWLSVVSILAAIGCGRDGFDSLHDGGGGGDGGGDGAALDASEDGAPLDPALVAWLQFEDDPADSVDDAAGANATCVTTCPTRVAGPRGFAYQFDGVANALVTPDEARFRITAGTAALWVRLAALPPQSEFRFLVGKAFSTASANSWELYLYGLTPTSARLEAGGDAASGVYTQWNWAIALDTWVHVAMTWDTTMRVYIDGTEVISAGGFAVAFDAHPLAIGGDLSDSTWSRFVAAAFDDMRIYNRVLSPTEILALAQ